MNVLVDVSFISNLRSMWMLMRQEVTLLRNALAQKAQAALLAKEQVKHLTTSLAQTRQLRASLTHSSGLEKLAAMRYSLLQSSILAAPVHVAAVILHNSDCACRCQQEALRAEAAQLAQQVRRALPSAPCT